MLLLPKIFVALLAIEHIYILILEMFLWTTPRGRKAFSSLAPDLFEKTKTLAANQGLYNGFLAAGLFWSLLIADMEWSRNVALFFSSCILVAGIYGGLTASKRILFVQAVPAVITLLSILYFQ